MICCVTGHRPKGFPFDYENEDFKCVMYQSELSLRLKKLIFEGYSDFISGMAKGVDIDFAQQVIFFRDGYYGFPHIRLELAIPYPRSFPKKTSEYSEYDEVYEEVLKKCNSKTIISPHYYPGCFQVRNEYMVDKSDLVFAVWNGIKSGGTWNTIQYAAKKGKPIQLLMLNEL